MLLMIANRPVPSTWLKSTATASEVWKESQLMYALAQSHAGPQFCFANI